MQLSTAQGLPIGSGVLSCRSFLMKSTRSLLRRKISCFRPAQAGGGGGDLGGGGDRLGGGRLGGGLGAVFLGVGLRVGFFAGAACVKCASQQPASGILRMRKLRGLQLVMAGQQLRSLLQPVMAWQQHQIGTEQQLLTFAGCPQLVDGVASWADPDAAALSGQPATSTYVGCLAEGTL